MNIISIEDHRIWDDFILAHAPHTLFQSWEWGEIEKGNGRKVWRIGLLANSKQQTANSNNLFLLSQIVKVTAKRGTFLHVRHGPLLVKWDKRVFSQWLKWIVQLAKKEQAWFIRISPLVDPSFDSFMQSFGFREAPVHRLDAEIVSVIDLRQPEGELFKKMRKTTRNLIRKSERIGVTVSDKGSISEFLRLHEKTFQRHGFIPNQNIEEEYAHFLPSGRSAVWTARHGGELIASAVIIYYGNQACYRHGASVQSTVPAAYFLQWEIIKEARRRGLQWYNLWGIADDERRSHPWWGLTVFKKGFGGETKECLHAQDLPLEPRYWFTFAIEKVRRMSRRY